MCMLPINWYHLKRNGVSKMQILVQLNACVVPLYILNIRSCTTAALQKNKNTTERGDRVTNKYLQY